MRLAAAFALGVAPLVASSLFAPLWVVALLLAGWSGLLLVPADRALRLRLWPVVALLGGVAIVLAAPVAARLL